jgi:hypothetical protein
MLRSRTRFNIHPVYGQNIGRSLPRAIKTESSARTFPAGSDCQTQSWNGNRIGSLRVHPPRLSKTYGHTQRLGLERALGVVFRREYLYLVLARPMAATKPWTLSPLRIIVTV